MLRWRPHLWDEEVALFSAPLERNRPFGHHHLYKRHRLTALHHHRRLLLHQHLHPILRRPIWTIFRYFELTRSIDKGGEGNTLFADIQMDG